MRKPDLLIRYMSLNNIEFKLHRIIHSFSGWHTNRKIIVIESDDWGSIRMPSKDVYHKCIASGYPVDKIAYEKYDSLLSHADLDRLFDLLSSFHDKNGKHPIITANCVVANPDFDRIRNDGFQKYHYEYITDTFKKYPDHSRNYTIWKEGIRNKIFFPQYHAREHLNVSLFMEALRRGDRDVHFGFANQMAGCINKGPKVEGNIYVEPTNYNSLDDKRHKLEIFLEGLDIFEDLFGYRSETIIPPNYTWSPDFDKSILDKGVKYIQGIRKYREPICNGKYKYHSSYTGKRNSLGQVYIVRNCIFEPSMFKLKIKDSVEKCLADIAIAFKMHKPAVIVSHRLNYVGFIDESNRDNTLKLLNQLMRKALKRWPDIEFMSSDQLGNIITYDSSR